MSDLLTVSEVAIRLGVRSRQVLNLIQSGQLIAFRLGASRAWIVTEQALADFRRRPAGRPKREKASD